LANGKIRWFEFENLFIFLFCISIYGNFIQKKVTNLKRKKFIKNLKINNLTEMIENHFSSFLIDHDDHHMNIFSSGRSCTWEPELCCKHIEISN